MDPSSNPADFDEAVRLHESDPLDDAAAIYRRILAPSPDHANAIHLFAVLEHQRGRNDEALTTIVPQ